MRTPFFVDKEISIIAKVGFLALHYLRETTQLRHCFAFTKNRAFINWGNTLNLATGTAQIKVNHVLIALRARLLIL